MRTGFFGDLSDEDKEIAEYGLKQGLILIGGLGLALIAGWLLSIPGQAVLFLVFTYALRIYAGGYHAGTPVQCAVFSAAAALACFFCLKYVTLPPALLHPLTLAAGLFILKQAPVDTKNKPLDPGEKEVYGRTARRIVLAETGLWLVSALLGWETGTRCISTCLLFMAVNLALGLADRKRRNPDHDADPDL